MTPHETSIPVGLCQCGCGGITTISRQNHRRFGWRKGEPKKFILGHKRKPAAIYAVPFKINNVYCRIILLTQGQFSVVQESDYWDLMDWKWWAHWSPTSKSFYAMGSRHIGGKRILQEMGSVVLNLPPTVIADHRNHETLLNTRFNLRPATRQQNVWNSVSIPHSTPFKGVCKQKGSHTFKAQISANGQKYYLGMFKTQEAAARAYDDAARRLHGEFAWTN